MAVTPADLLAPAGPVEVTLFPGENVESDSDPDSTTLEVRLQAYIDRAQVKASGTAFPSPDDAVAAWALYLTFDAAYMVAASRPSTENAQVPVLGSHGYAKDQRDALHAKAEEYRLEYYRLEANVPSTVTGARGTPSRETPTQYDW